MTSAQRSRSALDAVYRATAYLADWPQAESGVAIIRLRVGDACPALNVWLNTVGADCWGYLTAANPRSESLSELDNARRTAALRSHLLASGRPFLAGRSIADDGQWPAEASFLVAGLDENAAGRLAADFGQNAFLAGRVGEPVRLYWTPLAPQSG